MSVSTTRILALNCGSSSLKHALFEGDQRVSTGEVQGIGADGPADHGAAVEAVLEGLGEAPAAIAHRIVHGGPELRAPVIVDDAILATLRAALPFAELHLPAELRAVEAARARFPQVPQVLAFDTAFHAAMPEVAWRYALPRALVDGGLRRYGFHGLSYEHLVDTLPREATRRAVFAHLGSGASLVAVREGVGVDTTMGLTPSAGVVMATRVGDIDPGLAVHLLTHRGHDARSLQDLFDRRSGLRALSGGETDMRKLLARRAGDPHAAMAIEIFCAQIRKAIGALATVLGGLESLVFTGGIGAHAAPIRAEICERLGHLGVRLDPRSNAAGAGLVSAAGSACAVRVIEADEERVLARHARALIAGR